MTKDKKIEKNQSWGEKRKSIGLLRLIRVFFLRKVLKIQLMILHWLLQSIIKTTDRVHLVEKSLFVFKHLIITYYRH